LRAQQMSSSEVILTITVDVEEDNWGIHRSDLTVENVREINRLQVLFDRYGIKPTYLLTYQVASCDWAVNILAEIFNRDKCEIGAHLHPWNTPPLKEDINKRNTMLNNLPADLQLEKLNVLTDKIQSAFGKKPQSFRAGRWGLGSETIEALVACGYRIDTSVTPLMSWKNGPTYRHGETEPYWLPREDLRVESIPKPILEIPTTIGFNRWPFEFWGKIYRQLQKGWLKYSHPIGLFYHTRLLRKIWLSPELSTANDMIALSNRMIKHGKRTLNLTFHCNSLLPGKGPFIKDKEELEKFYKNLETYFEYLASATNFLPLTLSEVGRLFESEEL
jgi:hypothetical protein